MHAHEVMTSYKILQSEKCQGILIFYLLIYMINFILGVIIFFEHDSFGQPFISYEQLDW